MKGELKAIREALQLGGNQANQKNNAGAAVIIVRAIQALDKAIESPLAWLDEPGTIEAVARDMAALNGTTPDVLMDEALVAVATIKRIAEGNHG